MGESSAPQTASAHVNKPVRAIDGLRGVAALGIVVYHTRQAFAYAPELAFAANAFEKYYLLLDLFFVVSGYAIASGYAATFAQRVTPGDYGRFLWTRLARLYPLYLFMLLVLAAQETIYLVAAQAGWLQPPWTPWQRPFANGETFVTSLLMLQAWGIHGKLVWNIPAWYVSALFAAYLVFPFLAWSGAALPRRLRAALLVLGCGTGALALHTAYQAGLFPEPRDLAPLRAVLEFAVGYGLAQLAPGPSWRRHLQVPLLALVFAALHLAWPDAATLALMIAFFWSLLDDRGAIAAVLRSPPLLWLGAISYAVFLVHQPMLSWFDGLNNTSWANHIPLLWSQYFTWNIVLRLVLIVLAGWAAHRWIAEPARRWLDRRPSR